jgi:hypothetical protein
MQLRHLAIFILSTAIVCFDACKDIGEADTGSPSPGGIPGTYSYKGYNADGSLMVTGTMIFVVASDSSVSGTWTFVAVSSSDKVGPQVGSGRLVGAMRNGTVSINLNPGWADNNIFLVGTLGPDRFSGTWTWATFAGPTASGMFDASKKL